MVGSCPESHEPASKVLTTTSSGWTYGSPKSSAVESGTRVKAHSFGLIDERLLSIQASTALHSGSLSIALLNSSALG